MKSPRLSRLVSCSLRRALDLSAPLILFVITWPLAGCADSSAIITGQAHPATTPDRVQVYLQPPSKKYEVIGLVSASNKNKTGFTRQGKTDAAIRAIKEKAAEIGANGVILQAQGTQTEGAVGVVSGGVFITNSANYISVSGTAIFVP